MTRSSDPGPPRGRAVGQNPANRFERLHYVPDPDAADEAPRQVATEVFRDASRSILSRNDSPDLPFTFSVNPYRGCEHGCAYCYARPSHEYLGFSPGLDFETKIVVKENAPTLLAAAFQRRSWEPQVVVLSGNTDPYQPLERRLRLTRGCLEVFLRHRNPVGVITKNALVTRDADVLSALAALDLVQVTVSVTSLDDRLIGAMEPRTSRPAARLKAIETLSAAGIPVAVNVAPVIPGLTDEEVPAILAAAAAAGATSAGYITVRLPGPVEPLFRAWLERTVPERAQKVLNRLRSHRGGALNDARFGHRMRGSGPWAELLGRVFTVACRKHGLEPRRQRALATHHFRRLPGGQLPLFS